MLDLAWSSEQMYCIYSDITNYIFLQVHGIKCWSSTKTQRNQFSHHERIISRRHTSIIKWWWKHHISDIRCCISNSLVIQFHRVGGGGAHKRKWSKSDGQRLRCPHFKLQKTMSGLSRLFFQTWQSFPRTTGDIIQLFFTCWVAHFVSNQLISMCKVGGMPL